MSEEFTNSDVAREGDDLHGFKDWREKYLWLRKQGITFYWRGKDSKWRRLRSASFDLDEESYQIAPIEVAKAEALLEGRQRQEEMKGQYERLGDLLCEAPAIMLSMPPNPCNIIFHSEHGGVGELNWADGIMRFTGDADESAKAFFAGFAGYFQDKIQEEARQENESLRKDAERLSWIEKKLFEHHWNGVIDSGSRTNWSIWSGHRHVTVKMVGATFREAIDAAKEKP